MCIMLLITCIWLALHICLHAQANSHYNKFKSITKAPTAATYTPSYSTSTGLLPAGTHLTAATAYASEQVAWPPTLTHNNWFILQATAKAGVAADSAEIVAEMNNQPQQRITEAEARAGREQTAHSPMRSNYAAHIKQQQQQQLPVKYYAYNNSNSGNYRSPAQDVRIVEPYVLAFNNQRRQLMALDEQDHGRVLRANVNTDRAVNNADNHAGYVNTKSNNHNSNDGNNKSQSKHNKDSKNANIAQSNANNASNIVSQPQLPALFGWKDIVYDTYRYSSGDRDNIINENLVDANDDADGDDDDDNESTEIGSVDEAQLDEVFMPLVKVSDKIKQFYGIWKQIFSEENEPDLASSSHSIADGGETFEQAASATTTHATNADTTIPAGDTAKQLAAEVQGRRSAPTAKADTAHSIMQQSRTAAAATLLWPTVPRSTAVTASPATTATRLTTKNPASAIATAKVIAKSLTSAALVIGRGKKWKKKLKKFILPLLLAYKLKFMALVPLLIGGLTLLVGSTGLAGFFFALFLTVMSLKSGGNASKSIIIKKDW